VAQKRLVTNTAIIIAIPLLLLTLSLFQGCAPYKPYKSHPELTGYTETGNASYYALTFQFSRTASGETFNNLAMTAAHKTLPFGTKVLVTNVNNGNSVTVTINDRGPYIKGRIIDLTQAAFAKISDISRGIAKVRIRVLE